MGHVPKKNSIFDLQKKKAIGEKITFITCYDYPSACFINHEPLIDAVLIGDSVAMAVHGHPNTLHADIDMLILHTKAVARGIKNALIVSDLPFLCHKIDLNQTVVNVKQLMQAGAEAIKIEGADDNTCETIDYLVQSGIPIMGHIGLTPQSLYQLGGHKVQGKTELQQEKLLKEAQKLVDAGCFALVIECVPEEVGALLTKEISIPTIGIGAGLKTDGQILVWHDVLGLNKQFKPKFVKHFLDGDEHIKEGLNHFATAVKNQQFPAEEHTYSS